MKQKMGIPRSQGSLCDGCLSLLISGSQFLSVTWNYVYNVRICMCTCVYMYVHVGKWRHICVHTYGGQSSALGVPQILITLCFKAESFNVLTTMITETSQVDEVLNRFFMYFIQRLKDFVV